MRFPSNCVAFHICYVCVGRREGLDNEGALKFIAKERNAKQVERAKNYKDSSQYIREFLLFAVDVLDEEGKKVPLAPTVICHHCRVAIMDVNPDGSRINGSWMRCSSCKKMVCGPACEAMRTQCWGAKAEVIENPVVEGLGSIAAPQPAASSCERQSGSGTAPPS